MAPRNEPEKRPLLLGLAAAIVVLYLALSLFRSYFGINRPDHMLEASHCGRATPGTSGTGTGSFILVKRPRGNKPRTPAPPRRSYSTISSRFSAGRSDVCRNAPSRLTAQEFKRTSIASIFACIVVNAASIALAVGWSAAWSCVDRARTLV